MNIPVELPMNRLNAGGHPIREIGLTAVLPVGPLKKAHRRSFPADGPMDHKQPH